MLAKQLCLAASLVATVACVAEDPADDGQYTADPGDFDSKADGISGSSPKVLAFIDGAKTRLYAQLPTLADTTLLSHLTKASQRGVDVHVYVVTPAPAHPQTVLASEGLEANGVDITVERKTRLPGFLAVADDTLLTSTSGMTDKTPDAVATAASKFENVIAEDTSGTPPALGSDGTALMLMPDSGAGPIVSLIGNAQTSIDLEIYQLQSPAVVAALLDAHQRGVTVRVMLEPKTVGSQNYTQVSSVLSHAGIKVQATPPAFDGSHNVDHAKFMILDGSELVYGSGNMVRSGLGGNSAPEFCNRDFWIRDTRSDNVDAASKVFADDWARKSTSSTDLSALVLTPDNASGELLDLIDSAKSKLYVYNQSLNDSATISHLISAQNRGVDVHVLLGMQPGFGGAPPANQAAIDQLTGAGATAGFFTAHYLHGKVIVADGRAFVGSQNFTSGGLKNNRELGEILTSGTIVSSLAKHFEADQANPAP
jgi:cardiolipin synthase